MKRKNLLIIRILSLAACASISSNAIAGEKNSPEFVDELNGQCLTLTMIATSEGEFIELDPQRIVCGNRLGAIALYAEKNRVTGYLKPNNNSCYDYTVAWLYSKTNPLPVFDPFCPRAGEERDFFRTHKDVQLSTKLRMVKGGEEDKIRIVHLNDKS